MARSVENINSYIVANLVTNFATIGITINPVLWSKRNILRSICYTVAICQAYMEQLQDVYVLQIESIVANAASGSAAWVQSQMFKFQYSATNPQILALINTVPTYPVIDTTLQIITACSVTTDISNAVSVKVAKSNPLVSLSTAEIASAQSYIRLIGIGGINYTVISLSPDNLYVDANVYFAGQYAAVIQANVIAAISAFLQTLSTTQFNGALKISDLESLIRNVTGVNDVLLNNVRARASTDLFTAGIDLVLNATTVQRQFLPIAGYIIPETTVGKTFADSLKFIAE